MHKIKGFKVVSIIYIVIAIAFLLFFIAGVTSMIITYLDLLQRYEKPVKGESYAEYYGKTIISPSVVTIAILLIALSLIIVHVVIFKKNKEGKLTKNSFIFPIILGFVLFFIALPYAIVSIVTMKRVGKEIQDMVVLDNKEEENNELDDSGNRANAFSSVKNDEIKVVEDVKDNKTNKVTFIIVTLLYASMLIIALITTIAPVNILWDNREMNKVASGWLFAYLPSYLLYLFLLSPFKFKKNLKIAFVIISIVAMILIDIYPIILLNNNKDILNTIKEGSLFGMFSSYSLVLVIMIVSEIGIILLSLLSLLRLNPDKLRNNRQVDMDSKEKEPFYVFILKVLFTIIIAVFNSSLALMRLKEKHINIYSIFIILLTSYLCAVLSELLMFLTIIFVVGLIIMVIAKTYNVGATSSTKLKIEVKLDNGKTIILSQTSGGGDIWYDSKGHRWKENAGTFTYID